MGQKVRGVPDWLERERQRQSDRGIRQTARPTGYRSMAEQRAMQHMHERVIAWDFSKINESLRALSRAMGLLPSWAPTRVKHARFAAQMQWTTGRE